MILCDTGPIVAAINAGDKSHTLCLAVMLPLQQRLVTTRPCITEAMHLLRKYNGRQGQEHLMAWIESDFLTIYPTTQQDDKRACSLMRRYHDVPMDYWTMPMLLL